MKPLRILLPTAISVVASIFATLASSQMLREEQLAPISLEAKKAIQAGRIPGAVILIGSQGKIVYRRAFGFRALKPKRLPMTTDTIFDVASLTKVIATSTALMQLMEKGRLNLEDPAAKYWPEFARNGKGEITVQNLLTHYSGLRPALDMKSEGAGYEEVLRMIEDERPVCPRETEFIYSDVNFIVLGELVSRISGEPFENYCNQHIFRPLEMKDTGFRPSPRLLSRIAPTQYQNGSRGKMLWGEVHDPIAYRMGGVAGHAGLFSTADDLASFARMVLDGGSRAGVQILTPEGVRKMTAPQSPPRKTPLRGLGWSIDSCLVSEGSFGHRGYTGTGIWIDPDSKTYVVILTNRVHPKGKGNVEPLRARVLALVSEAVRMEGGPSPGYSYEDGKGEEGKGEDEKIKNGKVLTGIDVLASERFAALAGLRVGLITNHSGRDSRGRRTADLLYHAPNVKLVALFSPEHGFSGNAEGKISAAKDTSTGLTVRSLYGDVMRPTQKMLLGQDGLVFDVQDAGARFYTYITTMGYAMESAAKKGIPFYVLDRPNPINASLVQGPILDDNLRSFTGYFSLPVRHGMTVGELAHMFNAEKRIGVKLHVVKMHGYKRTDWYDDTSLPWVGPSPNLRTLTEAILYPGVAMVEGTNVSVGRGTSTPFEVLGAPWMNGEEMASYLKSRNIQGVQFTRADFTPRDGSFKNQLCRGIRIILLDRQVLDAPALGIEIACALHRLYPGRFQVDKALGLIGSREVLRAIKDGQDPIPIVQKWQAPLEEFCTLRSKYLLY